MENKSQIKSSKHPVQTAHKQQVIWQIGLPLAVFCVLIIATAVLLVYLSFPQESSKLTTSWSSISFILLAIPVIVFGFIGLIVLFGLIYAVSKGSHKTPLLFMMIENYISIGFSWIARISDSSVQPIIKIQSWKAILKKLSEVLK